jgi:hypothetical protein
VPEAAIEQTPDGLRPSGEGWYVVNLADVAARRNARMGIELASGDYFHSPPLTGHVLVGAGDGPCTIVMVGGRTKDWCEGEGFPVDAAAARYDASGPAPTGSPAEAYADIPDDEPARLPWPPPA